jgi:hypothetical protein
LKTVVHILVVLFTCVSLIQAKTKDSLYQATRAQYISDKTGMLGISLFNRNPNNQISINGFNKITYNPNDANTQGIRFQHKWFGIAFGYSPKQLQIEKRGTTEEMDLHLFMYGRKNYIDAYYVSYTGFYIENYKQNDYLRNNYISFPLLPNMSVNGFGLNYFYVFNHKKYSLRSSYLMNEIQRKSAGSFILGISANALSLSNTLSEIPQLPSQTLPEERLLDGRFYGTSVLPGYAHTFIYKKLFFTIAPTIGIVAQHQNITNADDRTRERNTFAFRSIGRIAFGYNSDRFYMAITGVNDTYNYQLAPKVELNTQLSEARIIIGYRFNTSGFVQKISNQMDNIIKL